MSSSLRDEVAEIIATTVGGDYPERWPEAADRILAIPAIADALKFREQGCQVCESERDL
jgi:hypothetical protein